MELIDWLIYLLMPNYFNDIGLFSTLNGKGT